MKSLTFRIFINTMLVGVAVYFVCSVIFIDSFYKYFENQIFSELENECDYLSLLPNFADVKTENRITIIDFHGKVIFDNQTNPAKMENHASREEFIEAMEKGSAKVSRYSSTMLKKTLYFAKKLQNGTVLRISCQQYTSGVLIFALSQPLLCLLLLALIISGLAASSLSKKIADSIEKIDFDNPEKNETFTEFKPFIKRINDENFEKKQREEIRRQFSANVSHELKTPLTSISGFAEIMKSGSVDEKTMRNFSQDIYNESQRMILLVNDILKLSKLDEESITMEKEEICIEEICRDVIKSLKIFAQRKNVSLELESRTKDCIKGVPTVIQEMIFNLVENAVKYNKENGKVFVKIEKIERGKPYLKLLVKDTGIGIAENQQERIFERFYRIDKSRAKDTQGERTTGTGLGLSIVKHGAKYHNAKVSVKSKLGEGSEFTLLFPII